MALSGDLTFDGHVNGADLASDLNKDGIVNGADLGLLIGNWTG